ncbi:MAG: hypothetical protein Q7J82_00890 [Coriobacteriia bacterium]|nr:hypothetical protein [Coriobacteriia bacterium]
MLKPHLPEDFQKRLRANFKQWEQTGLSLAKQGWSIPMSLEPRDVYGLLEKCATSEEVDAAFVRLYEADSRAVFESTASSLLACDPAVAWRPLLEQTFSAYRHDHYLVAIPALLVACEGVLATDAGNKVNMKRIVTKRVLEVEAKLPESLTALECRVAQAFVEELYRDAPFTETRPEVLNRHWILHGRDASDWTQADCLRLIQALWTFCCLLSGGPV